MPKPEAPFTLITTDRDPASGLTRLLFAVCALVTYANPSLILFGAARWAQSYESLQRPCTRWIGLGVIGSALLIALAIVVFFGVRRDETRVRILATYVIGQFLVPFVVIVAVEWWQRAAW